MKARQIPLKDFEVRAILEGRKTQTRRIVRPQPELITNEWDKGFSKYWTWKGMELASKQTEFMSACPYGQPGDLLWCRETWGVGSRPCPFEGGVDGIEYRADEAYLDDDDLLPLHKPNVPDGVDLDDYRGGWKPSIHMHRWASRLTLEVTDVRVERVQDISEADAAAEGMTFTDYGRKCFHGGELTDVGDCPAPSRYHPQRDGWSWKPTSSSDECLSSARWAFANLWHSINGQDSWDANPWVWVVEFRPIEANVDDVMKQRGAA